MTLLISAQSADALQAVVESVRREIAQLDDRLPVFGVMMAEENLSIAYLGPRVAAGKAEIRQRLKPLHIAPTREAALIEELAQDLDDCYTELLASGASKAEAYRQTLTELSGSELLARELRRVISQSNYSQRSATIGSTRVARRAGR